MYVPLYSHSSCLNFQLFTSSNNLGGFPKVMLVFISIHSDILRDYQVVPLLDGQHFLTVFYYLFFGLYL